MTTPVPDPAIPSSVLEALLPYGDRMRQRRRLATRDPREPGRLLYAFFDTRVPVLANIVAAAFHEPPAKDGDGHYIPLLTPIDGLQALFTCLRAPPELLRSVRESASPDDVVVVIERTRFWVGTITYGDGDAAVLPSTTWTEQALPVSFDEGISAKESVLIGNEAMDQNPQLLFALCSAYRALYPGEVAVVVTLDMTVPYLRETMEAMMGREMIDVICGDGRKYFPTVLTQEQSCAFAEMLLTPDVEWHDMIHRYDPYDVLIVASDQGVHSLPLRSMPAPVGPPS